MKWNEINLREQYFWGFRTFAIICSSDSNIYKQCFNLLEHLAIFFSFLFMRMRINRKEPQKFGNAGTPPLWGEGMADHQKNQPIPICVITSNMVVLRQMMYV